MPLDSVISKVFKKLPAWTGVVPVWFVSGAYFAMGETLDFLGAGNSPKRLRAKLFSCSASSSNIDVLLCTNLRIMGKLNAESSASKRKVPRRGMSRNIPCICSPIGSTLCVTSLEESSVAQSGAVLDKSVSAWTSNSSSACEAWWDEHCVWFYLYFSSCVMIHEQRVDLIRFSGKWHPILWNAFSTSCRT